MNVEYAYLILVSILTNRNFDIIGRKLHQLLTQQHFTKQSNIYVLVLATSTQVCMVSNLYKLSSFDECLIHTHSTVYSGVTLCTPHM